MLEDSFCLQLDGDVFLTKEHSMPLHGVQHGPLVH